MQSLSSDRTLSSLKELLLPLSEGNKELNDNIMLLMGKSEVEIEDVSSSFPAVVVSTETKKGAIPTPLHFNKVHLY